MRTALEACLKILLVVVVALIFVHFAPFVAVPLAVVLALVIGVGALMLTIGGIAGAAVLFGLLVATVAVLAALSPIWIPLALVLGIVWLVKRLGSTRTPAAPAA